MSRFQSRLFNWIDQSFPAKWGRKARRWLVEVQNQSELHLPENIRSEIWQAIAKIQQILSISPAQSDQSGYPKEMAANPVGDLSQAQANLPARHPQPLLTAFSAAIANLVKVVNSAFSSIIKIKPNSNRLSNQSNQYSIKNQPGSDWSNKQTAYIEDYWQISSGNSLATSFKSTDQLAANLNLKLDRQSTSLKTGESWWEKMQRLLQAAIAYFLTKDARSKKLTGDRNQNDNQITKTTTGKIRNTELASELNSLEDWYENCLPDSRNKQMSGTGSLATQNQADLKTTQTSPPTTLTTIEEWAASDLLELEDLGLEDSSLRAWIETQSVFLGYAYSPIMAVIHWCDRWVARLEDWLGWIWAAISKAWSKLRQIGQQPDDYD